MSEKTWTSVFVNSGCDQDIEVRLQAVADEAVRRYEGDLLALLKRLVAEAELAVSPDSRMAGYWEAVAFIAKHKEGAKR